MNLIMALAEASFRARPFCCERGGQHVNSLSRLSLSRWGVAFIASAAVCIFGVVSVAHGSARHRADTAPVSISPPTLSTVTVPGPSAVYALQGSDNNASTPVSSSSLDPNAVAAAESIINRDPSIASLLNGRSFTIDDVQEWLSADGASSLGASVDLTLGSPLMGDNVQFPNAHFQPGQARYDPARTPPITIADVRELKVLVDLGRQAVVGITPMNGEQKATLPVSALQAGHYPGAPSFLGG